MGLVRSAQSPLRRAAVAIVGTLIVATLAVGALAISHSAADDLAARKLNTPSLAGGVKPVRVVP
jgi:hypothetical protein